MPPSTALRIARTVQSSRALRLTLALFSAASSVNAYQQPSVSKLPATSPSSGSYGDATPVARPSHRAEVTYTGSTLTVTANNSSLNQILREIASKTGMQIVGGVAEDRVFGTYGPATPSAVLAALLDGTGSNMLIVQDASRTPTQLILSRRTGGITPPNPNAASFEDGDSENQVAPQAVRTIVPATPPPPGNVRAPYRSGTGGMDTNPAATSPSSTSQQLAFPPVDASTPPATATATPAAGETGTDAVKTPQQIFEQLQKLRQQQSQQTTKSQ